MWLSGLKKSLQAAGFDYINLDEISLTALSNSNEFLRRVKQNLQQTFSRNLLQSINDSVANPMMRTYKLFKLSHTMEPYILLSNKSLVTHISRFRTGSHNLRIHTGRYEIPGGLHINDRTCIFCSSKEIDDEYHFITSCQFHLTERDLLYTKVGAVIPRFMSKSSSEKFIFLNQSDSRDVISSLGKYLESCVRNRQKTAALRQA